MEQHNNTVYKMLTFPDVVGEYYHLYRILVIGGSGSRKKN